MRKQASVSSVVARHAAVKNPTVKCLGYALAGDGQARIIAEISHNQYSREDHKLVAESLSKMFENRMTCVSGSFLSIDKAPYTERIAGIVRVNTESLPKDAPAAQKMRSVSSNIFMDDEDKMWVLRKTESGDILVKNTGIEDHDSLRGLLDVVCSGGYSLSSEFKTSTSAINNMQAQVQGGSFVQYVSAEDSETRFGFVVASAEDGKLIVLPHDAPSESEGEVIEKEAVVAEYDTDEMPEVKMSEQEQMDEAVSTSRGVVNVSVLLDYYKKVYARSDAFYQEFAKRVRGHSFM